jgi:hypothetical protein
MSFISKVLNHYSVEAKILTPKEMADRRREQNESVLRSHRLKDTPIKPHEDDRQKPHNKEWHGPSEEQMFEALSLVAKELTKKGWKTDSVSKGDEVLDVWGKKKSDGFIELTVGGEAFSGGEVSFVLMWTSGEHEDNYDIEMLVRILPGEKKVVEGMDELLGAIKDTFAEARKTS